MSTRRELDFISMIDAKPRDPLWPRQSSLAIHGNRCDGQSFGISGGLEHGSNIRPTTAADRDKLVAFLQGIEYPEFQCRSCAREESACSAEPCATVVEERTETTFKREAPDFQVSDS